LFLLNSYACKKVEENANTIDGSPRTGIVSQESANSIAKNFFKMYYGHKQNREIEGQVAAIENGTPLFYVYNYKGGGFLVLSAEYGETPVLANGLEYSFPLKGEVNPGIGVWFDWIKKDIYAIKKGDKKASLIDDSLWKDLEGGTYEASISHYDKNNINSFKDVLNTRTGGNSGGGGGVGICSYRLFEIGPLMSTTWNQGCYYNEQVWAIGNFCERAPTGCVATSMAQILKYHSQPSGIYDFFKMPDAIYSSNWDVANLMRSVGILVDMSYSPSSSGAYTDKVGIALKALGYGTDVTYGEWSPSSQISNINLGRPVILDGCTDESCFLFWCWGSGNCHAWVSDGYQKTVSSCYGTNFSWYMNWGWGGYGPNGFYYAPTPPINNHPYIYYRKMLYNIHWN
jgi:hypothetical protein